MALLNPRFQDPGVLPGEAEHWTLICLTHGERIAGFGADPVKASERFEWISWHHSLNELPVIVAIFDSEAHEDFEESWDAGHYLFELPPSLLEPANAEGYEQGWDNSSFASSWLDTSSAPAIFNSQAHERFNSQWYGNISYFWSWLTGPTAPARFEPDLSPLEEFNDSWDLANTL